MSSLKCDMAVQVGVFGCELEIADRKGNWNFPSSMILREALSNYYI